MMDWNSIDAQAAREGVAIKGGYRGIRLPRSKAPPNRKELRERKQKKVNNLSLFNVIDGRIQ